MQISKERLGELALMGLHAKLERDGIKLAPKEIKRQIHNEAKSMGIPPAELAELAKLIYKKAYEDTMAQLEEISPSAKVEESEKVLDRIRGH